MDDYFSIEHVPDFECPSCQTRGATKRRRGVVQWPDCLTIRLVSGGTEAEPRKTAVEDVPDRGMDVTKYCIDASITQATAAIKYDLVGYVTHVARKGTNHYIR